MTVAPDTGQAAIAARETPSSALPKSARAVRLMSPGAFDGLELCEGPLPTVASRDVLIRVRAASLNFRDLTIALGHYPGFAATGIVPLSDGAGDVVAIGKDVTRARVGDRVTANCFTRWIAGPFDEAYNVESLGTNRDGMLSEYVCVPEEAIVRLPDYLSYQEAAALPCAAVSAWTAITFAEPLQPGQTVLVLGTGGVSLFALQFAKAFGARVIATTSSKEKAKVLRDLGADFVINYRESPDWEAGVLALTGGKGVDRVVEIGGAGTLEHSIAATRVGGILGLVGFVTGFDGRIDPLAIMKRSVILRGISIGPRRDFEALLQTMQMADIRPVLDRVYALEDFKSAYERLASGAHVGKVIVEIG